MNRQRRTWEGLTLNVKCKVIFWESQTCKGKYKKVELVKVNPLNFNCNEIEQKRSNIKRSRRLNLRRSDIKGKIIERLTMKRLNLYVEAFNVGGLNVGTFNIKGTINAVISNMKSWSEFMYLFYVESQAALNIGPS